MTGRPVRCIPDRYGRYRYLLEIGLGQGGRPDLHSSGTPVHELDARAGRPARSVHPHRGPVGSSGIPLPNEALRVGPSGASGRSPKGALAHPALRASGVAGWGRVTPAVAPGHRPPVADRRSVTGDAPEGRSGVLGRLPPSGSDPQGPFGERGEGRAGRPVLHSSGTPVLGREGRAGRLVVILKNPSTADASRSDPTAGKLEAWARRHGYGSLTIVNLFALRSTDPAGLNRCAYAVAVGPQNDAFLCRAAAGADSLVLAWGNPNGIERARYDRRIAEVMQLLAGQPVRTVGTPTKLGYPRHGLWWNADD